MYYGTVGSDGTGLRLKFAFEFRITPPSSRYDSIAQINRLLYGLNNTFIGPRGGVAARGPASEGGAFPLARRRSREILRWG